MFLQTMNREEQEKFLELVYKVAIVDGEFAEEEQEIVNNYIIQLGLDLVADTDDIDGLLRYFGSKQDIIKRIVLFEMIGLINADDKIEAEEAELMSKMIETFKMKEEESEKIKAVANKLQDIYDEIYDVLFE